MSFDDFIVKIRAVKEKEQKWNVLLHEDFEHFIGAEGLKDSGWIQPLAEVKEKATESGSEIDNISIISLDKDSFNTIINTGQLLKIKSNSERETAIVKFFQLPVNFPFDISDKPFEIKYNENMNSLHSHIGSDRAEAYPTEINENAHGPYLTPLTPFTALSTSNNLSHIQAGIMETYTDTYYIYSFEGKLLSEYDQGGNCARDYIYAGNRLIAEFRPATSKYYYYMSDQINSTRIITDDVGTVVYSEAYGPYGDIQKTWTNAYAPRLKFSGKEREGYTEFDYFGARYYDHKSYRFISVDPIITKDKAITNPQYWNLYAYCGNNPITFVDLSGLDNYVFYDPRNFSKQAKVEKMRLEGLNGELTHMKEIRTRKEFETEWSGMNNPTEVTLLFHSGGGAGLGNTIAIDSLNRQYLVADPSGKTPKGYVATYIGNLAKKSFDKLHLYICHSADQNVKNNLAATFYNTQDINTVIGVKEGFNYNRWYRLESPYYAPRESNEYFKYGK